MTIPPAIRFINSSALKVAVARWHLESFQRAEDGYSEDDFFRTQFLPAFAHSDPVYIQLAAAFDAFACAVAYRMNLPNAHKADFASWSEGLAIATGGDLAAGIRATSSEEGFARLSAYRNLVAHRSVMVGWTEMRPNENLTRNVVRFALGRDEVDDPRLLGIPDPPGTAIRDILSRDLAWADEDLYKLYLRAIDAWDLTGDKDLRADLGLRGAPTNRPSMADRIMVIPVTDEDLEDP
jgi:hypothetical protein